MVEVPKISCNIRICVDLKPLNQSVCTQVHPMPMEEEALAQLTEARVFSKLETNSGFWQSPLAYPQLSLHQWDATVSVDFHLVSQAHQSTSNTTSEVLVGLEGVICQMDDVLVFGRNQAEHDQ